MNRLLLLAAMVFCSLAVYVVTSAMVYRPLVVGDIVKQIDRKVSYAEHLPSPKIIIFAGSNGRYSHRCAVISAEVGIPCANESIASGIGIDFLFGQFYHTLKRGDTVYMPLEYAQYSMSETGMHGGMENAILVHDRREALWSLPWPRIARAFGAFDISSLIRGCMEMGLAARDFHRRTGVDTLTPEGDEKGHTATAAVAYRSFLRQAAIPDTEVPRDSYGIRVIEAFLRKADSDGIRVVGGLPTLPVAAHLSAADLGRIRAIYESSGQKFVFLPNLSKYELSCFYDSPYHLNEECQIIHSRAIGEALAKVIHGE